MYFVVYILSIKENRTVPRSWIRHVGGYLESFINNGINHNRYFYTFWTHRQEAFDENGIPRSNYPINIQANVRSDFPREGFYRCYIKKFYCKLYFSSFEGSLRLDLKPKRSVYFKIFELKKIIYNTSFSS